jgi:TrkA domain protein
VADIEQTDLPGVGTRYEFATRTGERVGVIVHRSGRRDLLLYDRGDPDACRDTVSLNDDDARTLSELLGGPRLFEHLDEASQQVAGLTIEWLRVEEGAPFASSTLVEAAIHTRFGVSIVAILRNGNVIVSPGAAERLEADDVVIAVGTADGVAQVAENLRRA